MPKSNLLRIPNPAPLIILVLMTGLLLTGCSDKPLKVDGGNTYTVLLLAGLDEDGEDACVAVPQVTHARKGDVLVFFSPQASAAITKLNAYPIGVDPEFPGRHKRLTDSVSIDLAKGRLGRVSIGADAEGTYEIGVECGGFPDDPPRIVVW